MTVIRFSRDLASIAKSNQKHIIKDAADDNEKDDGWRGFIVPHAGGRHTLQMCYATKYSNPCSIRINHRNMWVSVACGTTPDNARQQWFFNEGVFDLGEHPGQCHVAFRPVSGQEFPNISAFQFVPFEGTIRSIRPVSRHPTNLHKHPQQEPQTRQDEESVDASIRWRRARTSVTFTFEIGIPSKVLHEDYNDQVEYHSLYMRSKAIKFRFGAAHDAISIDGTPIGSIFGGEAHPRVMFVEEDEVIATATLGLSSYNGEGAFTALAFEKQQKSKQNPSNNDKKTSMERHTSNLREAMKRQASMHKELCMDSINNWNGHSPAPKKRPLVGAELAEPAYVYDKQRLGLNLWITSLAAPIHKPVARYGFTLSSDDYLDFSPQEFQKFWDWLVHIKHRMANHHDDNDEEAVDLDHVRQAMEPQRKFLLSSFSCDIPVRTSTALSSHSTKIIEGYLYGSRRHVSITFDVFSIYIYRLPDGETFQSTLFVDGKQYNTQKSRLEEIKLTRNNVLAFAISVALQDTDLLFQMGLIRPRNRYSTERIEVVEAELLPLKSGSALFSGTYDNTVMARRVVTLLALAGLRKVAYENVMDSKDGWDIYDLAAGSATVASMGLLQSNDNYYYRYHSQKLLFDVAAMFCALVQVVVPVFLIYRGILVDMNREISWDVYVSRLLFGTYAIFYETKTWDVDNGDRVTGILCFLPEFDTRKLIVGLLVNKCSKITVSLAIFVLMIRSSGVFEVTLNALALYFIVDVDDELVSDRAREEHKLHQRRELLAIKSKTALEYQLASFREEELPELGNLPARYFIKASHRVSTATICILVLGCVWMITEPWVLGWEFTSSQPTDL